MADYGDSLGIRCPLLNVTARIRLRQPMLAFIHRNLQSYIYIRVDGQHIATWLPEENQHGASVEKCKLSVSRTV